MLWVYYSYSCHYPLGTSYNHQEVAPKVRRQPRCLAWFISDVIMGNDGVSNHQPRHCLLSRLFRRRSKKTYKLRVTGLCAGNSDEFHAQTTSNTDNVSIWWRLHVWATVWLKTLGARRLSLYPANIQPALTCPFVSVTKNTLIVGLVSAHLCNQIVMNLNMSVVQGHR